MINDQIQITSLARLVNRAKRNGKLNTSKVKLFSSMNYALNKAEEFSNNGSDQFEDIIICIKKEISKLQYKFPDEICNYKVRINNDTINTPVDINNIAPTVSDNTIDILNQNIYTFTVSDFIVDFNDPNNDSYKFVIINYNPTLNGILRYQNNIVTNNFIIDIEGLNSNTELPLTFERTDLSSFPQTSFTFRTSDNNTNFLYSSLQNINILATSSSLDNLPPEDIGDNTLYVSNRAVTILTLFMFTGGLAPPYNDPEEDLIDAIRVIDISNANQGVYKVNGIDVNEGQIITREEIEQGLFTHEAANVDAITSDTFQFEARDEGSQIWVS